MTTTLLQQRDAARRARRIALYEQTRSELRAALRELLPNESIIVFGSLTRRGSFNDASDLDLALSEEPRAISASQLMVQLAERLERPVDVVLLPACRFRDKILREGELWTT